METRKRVLPKDEQNKGISVRESFMRTHVEVVESDTQARGNIAADKGVLHSDRATSIHGGLSSFSDMKQPKQ